MSKFDCLIRRLLPLASFLAVMIPGLAMASSPEWRPTYDMIMKYVNFGILAAVIYRYGREPIQIFLKQQQGDVVAQIDALEDEKNRVIEEIKAAQLQAVENRERLEEMKARLISQGESEKQQIVEQAQQQSAIMIEAAEKKMDFKIVQAQQQLKHELADLAFEQALQRLPQIMTDSDNQHLVDIYMERLQTRHKQAEFR
jgi:F-type H+-transporting ATPase subunit b